MAFFLTVWKRFLRLSPWKSASLLSVMEKNVGTVLLIQTADEAYYGKIERVWNKEVLIGIGDRIAVLKVKDITNIEGK